MNSTKSFPDCLRGLPDVNRREAPMKFIGVKTRRESPHFLRLRMPELKRLCGNSVLVVAMRGCILTNG